MAPSHEGGGHQRGGRSMSESDLREDETLLEEEEREDEERRRRRRGRQGRGRSWDQLDIRRLSEVAPLSVDRVPHPLPGLLTRAPSQATMHYTTVPHSLVSRQLGSRHHPTRSSLRLHFLMTDGTKS